MRIGYVIVSHKVMMSGRRIGYLYREEPDNDDDSGWRVFSGDETQEYANESSNFAMYNAATIVEVDPSLLEILGHDYPVAFERDANSGEFVKVTD